MASLRIPPPLQGLFWGFCMWGLAKLANGFNFAFPGQSYLAFAIIGMGLAIEITAVLAFFKAHTTVNPVHIEKASQLVTGGLYRFTRNPMYLGVSLLLTGWGLWLGNPLSLIVGVAGFVLVMNAIQIKPEEAALRKIFGQDYINYTKSVRRWI